MCIKTNKVGKQEVGIWRVQQRYPQYGIPIWRLWPNIRFLPSTVTEKNATKNILDGRWWFFSLYFPWCVITRYFVWLLPDIEVSTWDKRPKLLIFILSPLFDRIFHYIPCLISCPYFSNRFHLALIVSEIKKKKA
jgi:hypothetical protein